MQKEDYKAGDLSNKASAKDGIGEAELFLQDHCHLLCQ